MELEQLIKNQSLRVYEPASERRELTLVFWVTSGSTLDSLDQLSARSILEKLMGIQLEHPLQQVWETGASVQVSRAWCSDTSESLSWEVWPSWPRATAPFLGGSTHEGGGAWNTNLHRVQRSSVLGVAPLDLPVELSYVLRRDHGRR
ncbi:hypothetical protein CRUP_013684 [Coryphaenoides rupestris]|nr:hypothetical protein CRUP_013684 [Coryphaenoides rupestris]